MSTNFKGGYSYIRGVHLFFLQNFPWGTLIQGVCLFQTLEQVILSERKGVLLPIQIITITISQGIYLVHLLCSNYDGKFKSVGCNKFTLFPILGVERSFPFPGKVATGKGPFLSQERLQLGKVSAILGKLQLGKVSVILGKERILSFPRKGVVCNWERFQ